jgi:Na+/H+ antiporter NhaC
LSYGWLSLVPPLLAIVLAFLTRDAVFSLALACFAGVLLMGQGLAGFPELLVTALGNRDFMWICLVEFCIGILVAFYQRSGAVLMFSQRVRPWTRTREGTQTLAWGLGLFIFFSDYFSPLFVGPVMRDMTDRARVSREKLAYICDSTSAPVSVLVPITGWAVPFNFYALLSVVVVLLIARGVIPEFGPMRSAERRALETGEVLRPGSVPMMSSELTALSSSESGRANIWLNFVAPVLVVIAVNGATFAATGQARVLEGFMLAAVALGVTMYFQKVDDLRGIMKAVQAGIKGVMPAVMILALAYAINTVSRQMGTAEFVVEVTRAWFKPALLPILAFAISAFVSFATGTSWGTFAIMIPIAVPLAFEFSGGQVTTLVLGTVASTIGGAVFGDHCSPLSDTTVLSSLGSACDHMDHVKTQLPYALAVAALATALYAILGIF